MGCQASSVVAPPSASTSMAAQGRGAGKRLKALGRTLVWASLANLVVAILVMAVPACLHVSYMSDSTETKLYEVGYVNVKWYEEDCGWWDDDDCTLESSTDTLDTYCFVWVDDDDSDDHPLCSSDAQTMTAFSAIGFVFSFLWFCHALGFITVYDPMALMLCRVACTGCRPMGPRGLFFMFTALGMSALVCYIIPPNLKTTFEDSDLDVEYGLTYTLARLSIPLRIIMAVLTVQVRRLLPAAPRPAAAVAAVASTALNSGLAVALRTVAQSQAQPRKVPMGTAVPAAVPVAAAAAPIPVAEPLPTALPLAAPSGAADNVQIQCACGLIVTVARSGAGTTCGKCGNVVRMNL